MYAHVKGIDIAYETFGDRDGPAIVPVMGLLPGGGRRQVAIVPDEAADGASPTAQGHCRWSVSLALCDGRTS